MPITKLNVFLNVLLGLLISVGTLLKAEMDSYGIGYLLGALLWVIIVPFFLGSAVWYLSGKRDKWANVTFNTVVILWILLILSSSIWMH